MKGNLAKKGRYTKKNMTTTCELQGDQLNYGSSKGKIKKISLHGAKLSAGRLSQGEFRIHSSDGRTHSFKAEDAQKKKEWIDALNTAQEKKKKNLIKDGYLRKKK